MNSPVQVCREIKTSSLITLFTKRKCNHYICIRVVNQHRKGCYSEFIHRVHILLCGTKHSVYKNRVHIYLHCGNISIWQNILVTIDRITRCMLTYLLVNLKRKLTGIYLMIGVSGYWLRHIDYVILAVFTQEKYRTWRLKQNWRVNTIFK